MKVPAETVYKSLFNLICTIGAPQSNGQPSLTPLNYMSRRWQHWDQIGDIPMPAFFQLQKGIKLIQVRNFGPIKYELAADLYFYFPVDSGNLLNPTSPVLNNYFAALDLVLQPTIQSPGGARQQLGLGPLIEHCWVNGNAIFDEGLLAPPAILMLPITIVCG